MIRNERGTRTCYNVGHFKNPWKAQTFVHARLLGYLLTIFIEIYS